MSEVWTTPSGAQVKLEDLGDGALRLIKCWLCSAATNDEWDTWALPVMREMVRRGIERT